MRLIEHDERFKRAVNAVQEEFDERGLGEADLIVRVILDESGYPGALRGAVDQIKALSDRVRPDDPDVREAAYGRGYQAAVTDALEVLVRGR